MLGKDFRKILNNQSGIALMMVLSAIVILTALMADFSFESHINKLKGYNIEDRGQAKLTAESGLLFAMTRLKLYKEAFNYMEKNENAKGLASQEMINSIWNFPFIYPIPITNQMNQIQKDSLEKFTKSNVIKGKMKLTIKNISNMINLNLLRVTELKLAKKDEAKNDPEAKVNSEEDENKYNVKAQLFKSLTNTIESKSESDDLFASRYLGIDLTELVSNLEYYMSESEMFDQSSVNTGDFADIPLSVKSAPLTSFTEMYMIPRWNDELIELIQSEFTVHGGMMIDLNKITDKMLKILVPEINEEEIKDFFKYRDDPESPHFFNSIDDFKKYIVEKANLMQAEDFDSHMEKFAIEGIKFGASPSLFQIKSIGEKGRSTYTITAFVVLPVKPSPRKLPKPNDSGQPIDPNNPTPQPPKPDPNNDKEKQYTQLLEPRIVEIFIN